MFAVPWIVAHQAPLSMGFPRQKFWSGLPFPSPGDLPEPGIEPGSPALQADALTSGTLIYQISLRGRLWIWFLVSSTLKLLPLGKGAIAQSKAIYS